MRADRWTEDSDINRRRRVEDWQRLESEGDWVRLPMIDRGSGGKRLSEK